MKIKLSANVRTFKQKPTKREAANITHGLEEGHVSSIEGLISDVQQGIT